MTDRDRLIELKRKAINYAQEKADERGGLVCIDDEVDYLLANGVIVPPCKVGDTVHVVSQGQGICMRWDVYEGKVVDIHLNRKNKLTIRVENGEKFFGYYEPCFIHKTKEEAERALKEREGK